MFSPKMVHNIVIIEHYPHDFHVTKVTRTEWICVKRYAFQASSSQQEERISLDGHEVEQNGLDVIHSYYASHDG